MSAATLFAQPFAYIVDADGHPLTGAKISVYEVGLDTPVDVFHDPDLSVPWSQPIVTNAAGQSTDPIYCSPTPGLKIVVVDADDVPVSGYPIDGWFPYALPS